MVVERGEVASASGGSLVTGGVSENRTQERRSWVQSGQGLSKPTPRRLMEASGNKSDTVVLPPSQGTRDHQHFLLTITLCAGYD